MNQLHPGARWLFRLQGYRLLIPFVFFITFFWGTGVFYAEIPFWTKISIGLMSYIFFIIFLLMIVEIYARMSYNRWFYGLTNEYIKIEHGIIWKKYTSLPYEKVQNVDIRRGIIARMVGFSSLEIETAGRSSFGGGYGPKFRRRGGGANQYHSEGYLPAIDMGNAEKIREFVMKKIKNTHKGGEGI